ncbi:SDR family NAD(P)-dependent oxidoreductase [Streptomyces sp. 4N509B]|uniref:SDR family NAD(P)-dependent oxidoreductase n=1 Tax=Streptomyces sp. 4N509B TaxID=3457413 RepID=UPI003FD12A9B
MNEFPGFEGSTPLDGRVALVTGGTRGIGAAVVRALAARGADVVFTYERSEERATRLVEETKEAAGRRALAVRADSADEAAVTGAVEQAVAAFGRLDILVNNAGVFPTAPVEELTTPEIDRALAVNVRAPLVAARAAAPHLPSDGGGRIISIGSLVADRVLFPGYSLYAMTKSALVGMTRGLARELGPRGVSVTVVQPGPTDTDANPADGPYADTIRSFTALGRFGRPDEIAATVAHLAGAGGAFVTGTTITVDGGFNA